MNVGEKVVKIGNLEITNRIFLAPMAGVTDKAFRLLCKEQGAGLTFTEMVSAKGMYYDDRKTLELIDTYCEEGNVGVQIFGKEPDIMAEVVNRLNETDLSIIDINMGCPAPKITKNGEGSALMLNPPLVEEIVKAVVKVSKKPVTVKIRKGYDDDTINAIEVAQRIEYAGASAITVHGRTRKQQYTGVADWDIIRKVKESVKIPVIGNGDITSGILAKKMFNDTGCDAIMIGRGAFGNVWIFNEIQKYLKTGDIVEGPTLEDKLKCAIRQMDMMREYKGERTAICEMRKHIGWYLKGVRNQAKIKEHIFRINDYHDVVTELEKLIMLEEKRRDRLMQSDIDIAKKAKILDIREIAKDAGISDDYLESYGRNKAKISLDIFKKVKNKKDGKLILVTAINPTPAGEGKTTTTVGLGQAMKKIGKNAIIALREPSLGPVMGIKGGAAGGGYSQVVPMEDINLHFTGDIHAITAANNLLSALIDNHIHQGNQLGIDSNKIMWKRAMDMNDRALRSITVGLGGKSNGVPREDGFNISVASEVMAILCLANDLEDLKQRLGDIIIGYNFDNEPIYARDLKAQNAMALLLKDAIKPNIVQTLENTPVIMHGGPFANIAHGCNSVIATKLGLKLADYCITEAGFGADLGAEKFFDIKCRSANLKPDAVVIVATIRALKYNGGVDKTNLNEENIEALEQGMSNLNKHVENIKKFGVPVCVTINKFGTDTNDEVALILDRCNKMGVSVCVSEMFEKGGDGGIDLANMIVSLVDKEASNFKPLYNTDLTIQQKVKKIVTDIYGGDGVTYTKEALEAIERIEKLGLDKLPVCIAKTQYSLSDNPKLLGRPTDFKLNVREVTISNGAKFIVVITGKIMTMPGLPKKPASEGVDIDKNGEVYGLF